MRPWQFKRPKGPGFGISRDFYLSVLASTARLPTLVELANPKGERGAVEGFAVPLSGQTDKSALDLPMARGAYAIASKDRKTVLRGLVLNKDEAFFDPDPVLRSIVGDRLSDEAKARLRGTWTVVQLVFEAHDPDVYPSLKFLQDVVIRLGHLTDGVIADPLSNRYLLPNEVRMPGLVGAKVNALEHVSVEEYASAQGLSVFTMGMRKFAIPEYELSGLRPESSRVAHRFLATLAQSTLEGNLVTPGMRLGKRNAWLDVVEGGVDRGRWEGISVLEILPHKGSDLNQALADWQAEATR